MVDDETRKLYERAIKLKGLDNQLNITLEELAELMQAITKWKRATTESYEQMVLTEHIAEEIADVEIMTSQLKQSFKVEDEVESVKVRKLKRLEKRLDLLEQGKKEK